MPEPKARKKRIIVDLIILLTVLTAINLLIIKQEPAEYITADPKINLSAGSTIIKIVPEEKILLEGKVSYYSVSGCLGCDTDLIMANGEKFEDHKMTLAIGLKPNTTKPLIPLNTKVLIRNKDNGKEITAKITDTGGFYSSKYNYRIADLSKGLAEAINAKTDKSTIQIIKL